MIDIFCREVELFAKYGHSRRSRAACWGLELPGQQYWHSRINVRHPPQFCRIRRQFGQVHLGLPSSSAINDVALARARVSAWIGSRCPNYQVVEAIVIHIACRTDAPPRVVLGINTVEDETGTIIVSWEVYDVNEPFTI